MYTTTITLTADDTPATISSLMGASSIPVFTASPPPKSRNIVYLHIYPEGGNDVDATNGAARIGFDAAVSRVVATAHGTPLTPVGTVYQFPPAGGGAAIYDLTHTWISGKTGDKFQLQYGCI